MSNKEDIGESLIKDIAEIIYMELDIEYQDAWLKRVMDMGIWIPDEEDDCSCLSSRCEHRQERGIANLNKNIEVDE